ncbi:MAG: PIN domain-containing protein [Leptospiraceae bacterium]|nr:PIN domain-containing protein [Leptospiraceae bacterium]MCK6380426.1 PIN domain-containing protein [Leptospiraceae bacterium]NUM41906.1 PIN domain-containing protein [Leptospiraceae bacterium]
MVYYIESSILISILVEDDFYKKAENIWSLEGEKISSILTSIEAKIVLRRFHKLNKCILPLNWLSKKEKETDELLSQCYLIKIDERIRSIVDLKKEISDCRTLDAIHVATALFFKSEAGGQPLSICSFDARILAAGKKVGLSLNSS